MVLPHGDMDDPNLSHSIDVYIVHTGNTAYKDTGYWVEITEISG